MENIQTNLELNPFYVTGFSDGEGCFHFAIGKNPKYKLGYYVNPGFSIALHKKDEQLLRKIQEFFGGIGVLKVKKYIVQFRVFSIEDLNVVIKHFDKYPLITKKHADFILFKEGLRAIKNKEHLTVEGFNKIISIRASMNKGLPLVLKLAFPNITGKTVPLVTLPEKFNPYWVAGFTDAEGCFFVKIPKIEGRNLVLGFQLTQHNRDVLLLEKFITFFSSGRLELSRLASNFIVTKLSNITEVIIPFYEKYSILGSKARDFEDWKKIAKLMVSKSHLTKAGLEEIIKIRSSMNASRFNKDNI
uniref:LAGLIDADG endonuclease n=1 Tax=Ophiocordyceps sinensis TaxID=72228 RepID=A0A1X8VJL5_9HYPO|nr:LAGLIDADG endonuclease [Ophiocordyceps sinensis]ARF03397.1 LAGLIDADG endonuclease [Ophiocordyceps sinensis]QDH07191.1 LAGLIDADG endonuclease [Ophiocordyceps sinensis]